MPESNYDVNINIRTTDKTSGASKKAAKGLQGVSSAVKVLATSMAVAAVGKFASELFQLGVAAEAAELRFTQFAGGAKNATAFLDAFSRGTDGAVDRMTAMSASSRLLQMGLVGTTDEMEQIAAMAVKLGDQTKDAGDRIGDFSLLLSNQAVARLDNFGISAGRVRERINELISSGEALNREEAFKMAVMEQGAIALETLGDTTQTTAHKMEVAKAGWTDTKLALGQITVAAADMTGVLDKGPPLMRALADEMQAVADNGISLGASFAGVSAAVGAFASGEGIAGAALAAMEAHTAALKGESDATDDVAESTISATAAAQASIEPTQAQTEAAQNAAAAQLDLAARLKDATGAQIAQAAISQLKEALDRGDISFEQYSTAVQETQLAFGLADQKSVALAAGLTNLTERLSTGTLKASGYNEALRGLALSLGALPDKKTITIETQYTTVGAAPGGMPGFAGGGQFTVGERGPEMVTIAPMGGNIYSDTYNVADNSAMAAVQENQRRDKRASYMRTN